MHQLNNLDVILIIVTIVSMLIAFSRGLIKEVLSIIGWIISAIFIFYLLPYLTPLMKNYVASPMMASFVSALILLVVSYILWFLLTFKLLKKLRKSKLSGLDRGLGLIFGFLRAFLLVILFDILMETLVPTELKNPIFADSRYFKAASTFAEPIKTLIPEETLNQLKEKSSVRTSKLKENPEALFKELAEPKIKNADKAEQPAQQEGYDKQEIQSLDRLIENTAENTAQPQAQ